MKNMAKNIFAEWDKQIDDSFLNDVQNSTDDGFTKTPYGTYECRLTKAELKLTKKTNKPMVFLGFSTVDKKQPINYMQQVDKPFAVHLALQTLRALGTDVEIDFKNYTQLNDMLAEIKQNADDLKLTFEVEYSEEKGFDKVTINDVYEN